MDSKKKRTGYRFPGGIRLATVDCSEETILDNKQLVALLPFKVTPAADQVLATVELLESILLELPMRQLFVVQRTNRRFRDTIADSIALQRKMFLAPAPPLRGQPVLNPILLDCAFYTGSLKRNLVAYESLAWIGWTYTQWVYIDYGLRFKIVQEEKPNVAWWKRLWKKPEYKYVLGWRDSKQSWRRMRVMQRNVYLHYVFFPFGEKTEDFMLSQDVTMGQLCDSLARYHRLGSRMYARVR